MSEYRARNPFGRAMNDKELIDELYAQITDLRTSAAALDAELQYLRGERINKPAPDYAVVFSHPSSG